MSNLNVCICSLLQVLECYIISIEFFTIPLIWAFWIMLPAYIPNPVAALFGGGTPIDLGKNFSDGNRIFGDGKTYRGLITGILAGIITGLILIWLAGRFPTANLPHHSLLSVTLLAIGALLGDLVKSFFKRRFNMERGTKWPAHRRSRLALCHGHAPGVSYYPYHYPGASPGNQYYRLYFQGQGGPMVITVLRELLVRYKAIEFGEFTLASGVKSTYYIDVKSAVTHPDLLAAVASEVVRTSLFDVIAGVAVGGVPLAVAVSLESEKPYAIVRSSEKGHGKKDLIIGNVRGKNVLLIEDVTTSGGSALYGIEVLRAAGARADRVVTVVDREQGAGQMLLEHGVEIIPLVRVSELLKSRDF
jgi:orotate phosphoribosyltransferase